MTTIHLAYQSFVQAIQHLQGLGEAKSIARIVFEDAFQLFDFQSNHPFIHQNKLDEIQTRLLANEPVQYILGQADFYGLKFEVNPAVLIPRPETEELVYWILETISISNVPILDIRTGSGCIPITLKKKLPNAAISGVDISEKALAVAKTNALKNQVAVNFAKIDILNKKDWAKLPKFDIIVSNPPYIPFEEIKLMPPQVTDFEPNLALFVSNADPLIFYQTIAEFALEKLNQNGQLFFECNEFNAQKVVDLLRDLNFQKVDLQKDMEGKERMICATSI